MRLFHRYIRTPFNGICNPEQTNFQHLLLFPALSRLYGLVLLESNPRLNSASHDAESGRNQPAATRISLEFLLTYEPEELKLQAEKSPP